MPENKQQLLWPGWETVKLIGRGSFGSVYEIQRNVFDDVEKAALKVISIPQNDSDIDEMYGEGYDEESITSTFQSHLKSIVAEYSLMRKMNGCTNIVNCDDIRYVQHEDGIGWDIFIKMELLTPLMKALPADVPEETAIRIGKDICAALEICKEYGIVHRDIKPQNIFVSARGDYKLGDFGIAKTVEKTMGGTKIGTYKYMAPEVYNNQPYGSGADIYSLGLVLYWLLNEKRMPFLPLPPAKQSVGMEEEARNRRFRGEPLLEPAHGSDALKRIVLKACAYDPKARYQSAAEMREDIRKLDTGAVFVPPVVTASVAESTQSGEGTVNIFSGKKVTGSAKEKDTINIYGSRNAGEKMAYIQEEKSEYIRDEKTEFVPRFAHAEKEKTEKTKEKKNWIIFVIAGVLVVALLIPLLRSCGQPADLGETTGSVPGTTQNDGTTALEGTAAPTIAETIVPPTTEGTVPPTTVPSTTTPEQTEPPTAVPPVTQPAATLTGIAVAAKPGKVSYFVGDTLDTDGLTLKLIYSNGTTKTVTRGFSCSPTTLNTAGEQTVTVTYEGKSAIFKVTVVEIVKTGSCGENATYILDANGVLTISGTGETASYELVGKSNHPDSPWWHERESIHTIVIENGIKTIGKNFFGDCINVTSVTIPGSVAAIGQGAFGGCKSLTQIAIPSSVTSIGKAAFSSCRNLKSITIPASVTNIAESIFYNCENLSKVTMLGDVTHIGEEAFAYCESLADINIPSTVVSIGWGAFHGSALKHVDIPNGVTILDAFSSCRNLESITIPDSVIRIEGSAFQNCVSLKSITIPYSVRSIGYWAFDGCSNLRDIYIMNPECEINDDRRTLGIPGITTVHGYHGSTAQVYAEKYGFNFMT